MKHISKYNCLRTVQNIFFVNRLRKEKEDEMVVFMGIDGVYIDKKCLTLNREHIIPETKEKQTALKP